MIPAGAIVIKDSLGLNNTEYGSLGSVVFAGLTIGKADQLFNGLTGSILAPVLYAHFNTKRVLAGALTVNCLSMFMFT